MATNPTSSSRFRTRSPVNPTPKTQPSAPVRLKTVVRRLPPNLPEAIFWQSVDPWISKESVSWKVFYQGKLRKKLNKENIPSRAYILFKNEESLASFSRGYDGHFFRDKQGNESQAVVEFAPNQKVPPEKKKADLRHATIQQDEDYLSFVAALQSPPPKATEVDVEALLAATQPPEEPTTTPLLAALREQKASAHEKKLVASEATRAHSRKVAATAAKSVQKIEGEDAAQPAAKRSRKGKGTHPSASTQISTAPAPTNNPPAKPSKPSSTSRNRPVAAAVTVPAGPSTPAPLAATSSTKEAVAQGADEPSQRKSRRVIGLQSRHLKAALNGAGVTVSPAPQSSTTPISAESSAPVTGSAGRPQGGPLRDATGGGGEKQHEKEGRDGATKIPGGGRGGGKEKVRSRHSAGPSTGGSGRGIVNTTPRILSRQDSATAVLGGQETPSKDRTSAVGQETGGSRGRNRRGRGQS